MDAMERIDAEAARKAARRAAWPKWNLLVIVFIGGDQFTGNWQVQKPNEKGAVAWAMNVMTRQLSAEKVKGRSKIGRWDIRVSRAQF
jgi:hypothetical protein